MPYTVNGAQGGTFKTVSNLSFLRVFGAGHEVPYYREFFFNPGGGELEVLDFEIRMANGRTEPALALQVFKQTMMKGPIAST